MSATPKRILGLLKPWENRFLLGCCLAAPLIYWLASPPAPPIALRGGQLEIDEAFFERHVAARPVGQHQAARFTLHVFADPARDCPSALSTHSVWWELGRNAEPGFYDVLLHTPQSFEGTSSGALLDSFLAASRLDRQNLASFEEDHPANRLRGYGVVIVLYDQLAGVLGLWAPSISAISPDQWLREAGERIRAADAPESTALANYAATRH